MRKMVSIDMTRRHKKRNEHPFGAVRLYSAKTHFLYGKIYYIRRKMSNQIIENGKPWGQVWWFEVFEIYYI